MYEITCSVLYTASGITKAGKILVVGLNFSPSTLQTQSDSSPYPAMTGAQL